jgi:transposase
MTSVTVLSGPERRRRWTRGEKLRLVQEGLAAGVSVAEFARQRDIHPNLFHAWLRQARMGVLAGGSGGETGFVPVAVASRVDAVPPTAGEARGASVVEVVLRNGRVLRLCEGVAPGNAARLADALEAGR